MKKAAEIDPATPQEVSRTGDMDSRQVVIHVKSEGVPVVCGEDDEAVEKGAATTQEMFKAGDIDLHEVVIPGESEGVPVVFGEESEEGVLDAEEDEEGTGVVDAEEDEEGTGVVDAEEDEEEKPKHKNDAVTKLQLKRDQLLCAEIAIHAQDYVRTIGEVAETVKTYVDGGQKMAEEHDINLDDPISALEDAGITDEDVNEVFNVDAIEYDDVADTAGEGGEALLTIAENIQEGGDVGEIDPEVAANIANGVVNMADHITAAGGAANAGRQLAEDAIVDGHKCHECINDTCLEVPVRYVAENWAIPCYEFIAVNICKPFCTCFCKSCCNTEADNAVENTEDLADGTAEGAEVAEGVMEMSGLFDASQLCMSDALWVALPFIGVIFSCFRLYQGTSLSCRGCIGAWGAVGKARASFQWMVFEGQLRLGQGCCGLLGAAPGLIIITMPSIFTLGFMAGKARKTRLTMEGDSERDGQGPEGDTETNDEEAYSFPDSTEKAKTLCETYEVISGRAKAGAQQSVDYAELMESGLVASEPRFIYPDVPRGTWSTGIFDCMKHIPSCLTGCLCSCIIYGQVAEGARLFKGVFYVTLIVYILSSFTGHAPELWIIYAIYLVAVSRKRIAEEYGIPLNPVENICLAFFCSCCAATQVARHMFGWGEKGLCEGGFELGPEPIIRWQAMPRRVSSVHQMEAAGYVETNEEVVDAPTAMPPMMR